MNTIKSDELKIKDLFTTTLITSIIVHILIFSEMPNSFSSKGLTIFFPIILGTLMMILIFKLLKFSKFANRVSRLFISWFSFALFYCFGFLIFIFTIL